ncbi:MAG TPA: hypothetical protein VIN38_04735 [Thiobacillus sp.]
MKTPPFAVLKLSILLAVIALALTTVGSLWSWRQVEIASAALQQANSELNAARKQLDLSHQQKQLIATHLDAYQALKARGFIGAENRLAWVEAAQQANRDTGLYGLDYRLTPQVASPAALAQGLKLGQTSMTLIFPILVETDLPRFLAALKQRAPGIFDVQRCKLSLQGDPVFEAINQPRMLAECELLWFTIAEQAGGNP